jgi:hypothetical protein
LLATAREVVRADRFKGLPPTQSFIIQVRHTLSWPVFLSRYRSWKREPELDEALELLVALLHGRALRLRNVGPPREDWAKAELIQPSVQYPLGPGALSAPLRHETKDLCADLTQD